MTDQSAVVKVLADCFSTGVDAAAVFLNISGVCSACGMTRTSGCALFQQVGMVSRRYHLPGCKGFVRINLAAFPMELLETLGVRCLHMRDCVSSAAVERRQRRRGVPSILEGFAGRSGRETESPGGV